MSSASVLLLRHGPNKDDRPDRVQRKQTQPTGDVDRLFVRMLTVLGDRMRKVVDIDERVEHEDQPDQQNQQSEIVQEHWSTPRNNCLNAAESVECPSACPTPDPCEHYSLEVHLGRLIQQGIGA